ncbi:fibronectin type III domain-containing protein [Leptospira kanakyensis]|uniref:Fibronectin type III n=1 Tax=Leptospira kanakyensis TaxID=2484968 RepID=A0A6N4Q3T1_9LEPT|nr:fibronectin type III domain-containing protein [Leptospira kanakyensis]MCW7479800.1 fibronectin type III [Leptospira kanakyensis]TGK50032.1 fibronectin type III [Leptospira kanakyensis]TGK58451.1 fibronectin type III [Leptospira kanakyensis]TGK69170.1 fibronectin type III [Leptospira kanakyensis]
MKKFIWILFTSFYFWNCIAFLDFNRNQNEFSKDSLLLLLGSKDVGVPAGGGTAGSSGTRIQSSDELFTILIPEGAMDETVDFKITKYDSTQAPLPSGFVPTSSIYQVTPSYKFKKDVVVTITLDRAKAQSMNLNFGKSRGFHVSTKSTEPDAERMPGWAGVNTTLESESIVFQTKSFSMFGGGTPPPGNLPPVINGAYYYLKPSTRHIPYEIRADVFEPDNDVMNVYLVVGPAGGPTNYFSMTREGTTNWYRSNIPYEAMSPGGILIQIVAVDIHGQKTARPSTGTFLYPTDSGNPAYISQYTPDRDGDGYNDVWELDNGYNPNNASSPPGGTTYPPGLPVVIDSLEILPTQAWVQVNEPITFSARGFLAGVQKFVNVNFHTTGIGLGGGPIGNLNSSTFTATTPGIAGVFATYQTHEASASVHVADTIAPSNITDLVASPMSSSRIQLRWTAPGSVGALGQASAYEIRRSTSPITNNLQCDAATGIAHTMIPKNAGLVETKEIDGHLPQSTYYFCVRAIDSAGNRNSWSGVVSATTYAPTDLVPPADITTATATVESYQQIKLTWTAVGDNGNVGSASAYEIRRRSTPINSDDDCSAGVFVPNAVVASPAGTPLEFTVSGLSSGTVHYFCIRAFDHSGNRSLWSGVLQATTPFANQAPVIQLTTNLTIDLGTEATLDASQSVDPDSSFCGAQSNLYEYNWRVVSKPPLSNLANSDIQNRTTKLAKVLPDKNGDYVFEFSFKDNAGSCAGGNRTSVTLVTLKANLVPIDAPAYVEAQAGGTSAFVQWWPITGATSYTVYYSTSPGVTTASTSFGPVTNPYAMITGLTTGTLYYFRVVANNFGGSSVVSAMEPRAFTTTTPPGMSATGTHIDISAALGNFVSRSANTLLIDNINSKLIIGIKNDGGGLMNLTAFHCDLNGNNCSNTNYPANLPLDGYPKFAFDFLNSKLLGIYANHSSGAIDFRRCNALGTDCIYQNINAGKLATWNDSFSPLIDYSNQALLVSTCFSRKPALFKCNLDGSNCSYHDISAGAGTNSCSNPNAVIDYKNQKLLFATPDSSIVSNRISLFRCNLDGSNCNLTDISAGLGSGTGTNPAILVDNQNSKLLTITQSEKNDYKLSLYRCNLDGSNCIFRDISAGQSNNSASYPSATIDYIEAKLLVVTYNLANSGKLSLYRCNLDGTECTHTDLSSGQGTSSGGRPSVIINPITGKLNIATTNGANSGKPSLFIW